MSLWMFWLGAAAILLLLELATPTAMVSLWFVAGGICAAALSLVTDAFWIQIAAFVLVSLGLLLLFRPMAMQAVKGNTIPTNADRVIGKTGTALCSIGPEGRGRVQVLGTDWLAVTPGRQTIAEGSRVRVTGIEGAKVIVMPAQEE